MSSVREKSSLFSAPAGLLKWGAGAYEISVENPDWIHNLIRLGRGGNTDLPDLLIGIASQANGCEATLTFDRKAARSPLFEVAA
jgi:predicted nucleic-acid-binding protein